MCIPLIALGIGAAVASVGASIYQGVSASNAANKTVQATQAAADQNAKQNQDLLAQITKQNADQIKAIQDTDAATLKASQDATNATIAAYQKQTEALTKAQTDAQASLKAQQDAVTQSAQKAKAPSFDPSGDVNRRANGEGVGSTMLTGAGGIDPSKLLLGKTTLLGA